MIPRNARKILVINLRYIGDTLWMLPFLKNLRMNIPDAEISALVNKGGEVFLRLMPGMSDVIAFDRQEMKGRLGFLKFIRFLSRIRQRGFDVVFVLSNSDRPTVISLATGAKVRIGFEGDSWWRSSLLTERLRWDAEKNPHLIEYQLQALTDAGLRIFDRTLTLDVPEDEIKGIIRRFNILKQTDKRSILVHPGARTRFRQWGTEKFAGVMNAFSDTHRIFLIGGPQEGGVVQDVLRRLKRAPDIVSTELSLLEFAALSRLSDLFLGNDSAPIHIAAAAGTCVIGIYGPTLSKHCGPWTEKKALFDISTLPCRLCRQDVCTNEEEKACMNEVTPEMVINRIREVFDAQFSESPDS
ncbi:MAG: glycosyltransferase family 9 protein [Nitrospirae bacterium]|nr:glycosyltransferase family 9 protein [Nitrospirota bacterium]